MYDAGNHILTKYQISSPLKTVSCTESMMIISVSVCRLVGFDMISVGP
jgi:hypothetical protein